AEEQYDSLFTDKDATARLHFLPLLATFQGENFESIQAFFRIRYGDGWMNMKYRYGRLYPLVDEDGKFTPEYLARVSNVVRNILAVSGGRLALTYLTQATQFLPPLFMA